MAKNTAAAPSDLPKTGGAIDFSTWTEERFGFAPYWSPEKGQYAALTVLARDERDPDFVRYLCRAEEALTCKQGPKESAVDVPVLKGEEFTISTYHALAENFDTYLASGLMPKVRIMATEKVKTNTQGRTVWKWKGLVEPGVRPALDAFRASRSTQQLNSGKPARELTSS